MKPSFAVEFRNGVVTIKRTPEETEGEKLKRLMDLEKVKEDARLKEAKKRNRQNLSKTTKL